MAEVKFRQLVTRIAFRAKAPKLNAMQDNFRSKLAGIRPKWTTTGRSPSEQFSTSASIELRRLRPLAGRCWWNAAGNCRAGWGWVDGDEIL
jgi:hypothetical protein